MVYDGTVYVPGADSYIAKEVSAAGGEYLFSHISGTSSTQISIEEFYNVLMEADIWIYSSDKNYVPDYATLFELAPIVVDAPVVTNQNVWQFDVNYYMNTNQADKQVIELAAIFYPELFPDYSFSHYNLLGE